MSRALPQTPPKYQGQLSTEEITALRLLFHHAVHPDRKTLSDKDTRLHLSSTQNENLYEFHRRRNHLNFHKRRQKDNSVEESLYNRLYQYYARTPAEVNAATWPLLKLAYRLDANEARMSAAAAERDFWSPSEPDNDARRQAGEQFAGLFWSFRYLEGGQTSDRLVNCTLIEVKPGNESGDPPQFRAWFRFYSDAHTEPLWIAGGKLHPLADHLFWAGHLSYRHSAPYIHVTRFSASSRSPKTVFSSLLLHRGTLQRYMAARTRFLRIENASLSNWITETNGAWRERKQAVGAMTEAEFSGCDLAERFGTNGQTPDEVLKSISNETPGDGKLPLTRHP